MNLSDVLPGKPVSDPALRAELRGLARRALQLRHLRSNLFGPGISKEVAWDMLLALYAIDRRLTIGRLTHVVRASGTTALRWLEYLEQRGLTQRASNPMDARSSFVTLTEHGEHLLDQYLFETRAHRG